MISQRGYGTSVLHEVSVRGEPTPQSHQLLQMRLAVFPRDPDLHVRQPPLRSVSSSVLRAGCLAATLLALIEIDIVSGPEPGRKAEVRTMSQLAGTTVGKQA